MLIFVFVDVFRTPFHADVFRYASSMNSWRFTWSMLSFCLFMQLIFTHCSCPLTSSMLMHDFDFWYTVLLIFTHCLPPSTFSMLTHDSTSGVCRFVNNCRQIIVVWVYLWTCMEKLGASHSSDSLRSKRVKYTRKEYVSTSYLRL